MNPNTTGQEVIKEAMGFPLRSRPYDEPLAGAAPDINVTVNSQAGD